jgi:hypothetical protein
MDDFFTQASDTLDQFTQQAEPILSGSTPNSQVNVLSDEQIKKRNRNRIIIVTTILLGILAYFMWRKFKK